MNETQEWKWEGSIWDFVEIVQWAFVFHKLGTIQDATFYETMKNPKKVEEKANEFGMTYEAIAKQMVKCGKDILKMSELTTNLDTYNEVVLKNKGKE